MVRKQIVKLEQHRSKKFPELKAAFYVSRRNNFVHMGIDEPLFKFKNHTEIIAEIIFFKKNLKDKFIVTYPYLIHTAKWKYDYIVSKKKRDESKSSK